ncbi:MAG TPA: 23S rRNA (pseudouridine(1915)-N(3))-methyltransferase RlmH [Bacilli bacterium]|nr:23S rRNA (pseudouridine(1915)-N(3))-methyltransferase RlmH [Bacilli bacterium]
MNINVIALSKVKDKHLASLIATYFKRLQKYAKVKVVEIKESYIPLKFNEHDINKALLEESKAILSKVKERDYVILLAPNGKTLDSVAFSEKLIKLSAKGTITFIIGSSYGVHTTIYSRANETMSFSPLTFPHELFRLLLFEQLFRAFKIINNETYHK